MRKKSKYTLAWEQLKTKRILKLVAEPASHKIIRQHISRKKDKDLAYKFQCSEAGIKERIVSSTNPEQITVLILKLEKDTIDIGDL